MATPLFDNRWEAHRRAHDMVSALLSDKYLDKIGLSATMAMSDEEKILRSGAESVVESMTDWLMSVNVEVR